MASTVSPKRRSVAPELSRESVIEHALGLADREGLDAVAIRRIAADFGVTPMALYWHFRNKDELLEAMGDKLFESMRVPDAAGEWLDEVRAAVTALVEALRRHPGAVELAFQRVLVSPQGRLVAERALGALRSAGFSVREASDIARQALQTAVILVSGQPGMELDTPEPEREALTAAKRAALTQLSVEDFPNLVACAEALTECDDEDLYYGSGIELYVAGVKELSARNAAAV